MDTNSIQIAPAATVAPENKDIKQQQLKNLMGGSKNHANLARENVTIVV